MKCCSLIFIKCRLCRPHKIAAESDVKMLELNVESQGDDHESVASVDLIHEMEGIEGVSENIEHDSCSHSAIDLQQFPQVGYMDFEGDMVR